MGRQEKRKVQREVPHRFVGGGVRLVKSGTVSGQQSKYYGPRR